MPCGQKIEGFEAIGDGSVSFLLKFSMGFNFSYQSIARTPGNRLRLSVFRGAVHRRRN